MLWAFATKSRSSDVFDLVFQARHLQDLLANVAPKKPNWDLRRDVESRLSKLERRTQRALAQLAQQQQAQAMDST